MCRDPIYEKGGANLNRFIANSSISFIDISGCFVLPVILIPPEQNPFLWTCHTAMQQCHTTIKEWRDLGYHFAADLLEHFINGGNGDYIPFPDNIAEIISNGHSDTCKKVAEVVCGGTGTQRQILIKPDDENDSNIRWWYLGSNKNMLYAYGGARITISGTAIFDNTGRWSGEFDVEIKDKYEWVKADGFADIVKEYLSRLYSQTYDAAVYLQQNCGKKVFSHVANFDVTCTGCCQQVGSQR